MSKMQTATIMLSAIAVIAALILMPQVRDGDPARPWRSMSPMSNGMPMG